MEYMPRGKWTPDLDPPIVLGNLAETDEEMRHYARIMNDLEIKRREREVTFQGLAMEEIYIIDPASRPNGSQPPPKTGIAKSLINNKRILRSIFIDAKDCSVDCRRFITLAIASSSSATQVDIHITGVTASGAKKFLSGIGLNDSVIERRNININASRINPAVQRHSNSGRIPYYINKSETQTTIRHME